MTKRRTVLACAFGAIALFCAFYFLGAYVSTHPEPRALWELAHRLHGRGTTIAWAITHAGYASVLGPLYGLLVLVAIVSARWRVPALFVVAISLACWGGADAFQHFFARPRRADWLVKHETAFSYPSSHAAISTGFYFLAGLLVFRASLPRWVRYGAVTILSAFTLAILWSRVELGAHFVTDVAGGVLLALALSCAGAGILAAAGLPLGSREKSLVSPGPLS